MTLDCQLCGACCFSDSDAYVPVNEGDRERLGEDATRYVWSDGQDLYLKMKGPCCSTLEVRQGRFVCAIYDQRPDICRELQRCSPDCRAELALKKARARRFLEG